MDIETVVNEVNTLLAAFAPAISTVSPTAATAIATFQNIAHAALAGEQSAAALVDQVKTGTPLTAAQIAAVDANLATALTQLDADITAADKD